MKFKFLNAAILSVMTSILVVKPSMAQSERYRPIGPWMVSEKKDPFGDGRNLFAITLSQLRALTIRCFDKNYQ